MQVVAGAVTGTACITYNLPCRYRFPCGNGSLRHVGVPRGQTRTVIQQHLIAVAVVPAADQHRAAVGSQNGCSLRRGNIRAAMPGVTVSVVVTKIAGNIGVAGQRPAQRAILDDAAAKCQQAGTHFLGKQLVQNVPLVLRKAVQTASASTDLLLTVMCRMYSVTGSGSGSSSVGSGVAVTSSTSARISCIVQKVS